MPSHDKEIFQNLELMTNIRSGMMDGGGHILLQNVEMIQVISIIFI